MNVSRYSPHPHWLHSIPGNGSSRPWARLHLDFAGPFQGKTILVLIDTHSMWIEAICTPSTSSSAVIDELRTLFAKFGLPETIVTDNGTGFTSQEFKAYLKNNGVKHVTSSPYHPASNGLAERAVQIIKRGLKKVTSGKMSVRIAEVLFTYRVSPHTTTGVSPAELLLGRRLRTRLDIIRPNTAKRVEERQDAQKAKHDTRAKARAFKPGDKVYVKNFGPGQSWLTGEIMKSTGPVSYHVQLTNGRTRHCHQDQLRPREGDEEVTEEVLDESPEDNELILTPTPTNSEATDDQPQGVEPPTPIPTVSQEESPPPAPQGRYLRRNRKKRVHFEPSNT